MDTIDLVRHRAASSTMPGKKSYWETLVKQKQLVFMSVPVLLYIILFSYVPTLGWVMAFQNFQPAKGFLRSAWAGLDNFKVLFTDPDFYRDFRNSIGMSSLNLVFSFATAIILALLLNEFKNILGKRVIQTVSYLPHFLSWVIVCSLVVNTLSIDGIINQLLVGLGILHKPVVWLGQGNYFWGVITSANVWKEVGWNSIIYIAAISGIDPALYEAAVMDGAGRFQKMRYITLPGIRSTFVILLVMSIGWIMQAGFEPQYLLRNGLNIDFAETLELYVIKYGFQMGNFSLATAAGILMSTINIAMLLTANFIAKKVADERLI